MMRDTGIKDLPKRSTNNRLWDKGNNPKTPVWEFLKKNDSFIINKSIENKLIITGSPDMHFKRLQQPHY